MSKPTPTASLGPAVIVSVLLLLFAGGAYIAMTDTGDEPATASPAAPEGSAADASEQPTSASEQPTSAEASDLPEGSEAAERPTGPAQPNRSVPSPNLLAMAGGPTVTPDSKKEMALGTLEGLLPKLKACASGWVSENPKRMGKAFLVFTIDPQGRPVDLTLQYKSVRSDDLHDCFATVLGGARFETPDPAAKVFWPLDIGGRAVVAVVDRTGDDP